MMTTMKENLYQCSVCGYIYEPSTGDSDGNVEPGTEFGDLPDEWTCPICQAEQYRFVKI